MTTNQGNSDVGIQQLANIAQQIGQLVSQFLQVTSAVAVTTTEGDLIVRGPSANQRLPIGAADTLLASDGTTADWQTVSDILDAALGSTQGSIIYRGASSWAVLGPGTVGQVLTSGGAGADPSWA